MYVVIGANGYLGRYCIKNILKYSQDHIVATYAHGDKPAFSHPKVEWMKVDVCDNDALDRLNQYMDQNASI